MTYTYTKPKGVTYTQMAIKIDDMAYSDSCDDELLFEYLYHLSFMLAYKAKYFKYAKGDIICQRLLKCLLSLQT